MKYAIIFCFSLLTIGSAFGQKNDEKISKLSDKIEQQIISNYHIWPSSEAALSLLPELNDSFDGNQKFTNEELIKFKKRFDYLSDKNLKECLMMYARPLLNKEKARLSSGP